MEAGYQVIARRWRPKQFDELVGQDHIVRTLRNAIDSKRIAHAYLFVGPRGTGKTSTARLFAKALNAEGGPSAMPDNSSEISQSIMNGSCMDVIEIDGASNNSVDQVRSLREDCQYAPTQCSYKIYIIDEVHMLSTAAFNALLKTLEEPPEHVKFFFATTEAHKVLPTIVSRCQRFEFRPISDQVIADKLTEICKSEAIEVEASALMSIARLANGGMRDAQSILDQMISFCGTKIAESDVLDVYGLVSDDRIVSLAKSLGSLDFGAIVEAVDAFANEGRDLYRVLLDLENYVRMVLLDAIQNKGSSDLLGTPLRTESIMRMLDALHRGEASVQRGLSEKANFEVVLLKASEESRSRAIDSLIKQLAQGAPVDDVAPQKKKALIVPDLANLVVASAAVVEASRAEEPATFGADEKAPLKVEEDGPSDLLDSIAEVAEAGYEDDEEFASIEDAPSKFVELPVITQSANTPLIDLEAAASKIGPEILEILDQKFKGTLTEVRYPDAGDLLN